MKHAATNITQQCRKQRRAGPRQAGDEMIPVLQFLSPRDPSDQYT
jgi:hypothetical protein